MCTILARPTRTHGREPILMAKSLTDLEERFEAVEFEYDKALYLPLLREALENPEFATGDNSETYFELLENITHMIWSSFPPSPLMPDDRRALAEILRRGWTGATSPTEHVARLEVIKLLPDAYGLREWVAELRARLPRHMHRGIDSMLDAPIAEPTI